MRHKNPYLTWPEVQIRQALKGAIPIVEDQVPDGTDGESAHLVAAAAELYQRLYDEVCDRLEHEQREHEITKGYRQHAERLLEEARSEIERLEWRA